MRQSNATLPARVSPKQKTANGRVSITAIAAGHHDGQVRVRAAKRCVDNIELILRDQWGMAFTESAATMRGLLGFSHSLLVMVVA